MVSIKLTNEAALHLRRQLAQVGGGAGIHICRCEFGAPGCGQTLMNLVVAQCKDGDEESKALGIPFSVDSDILAVYGSSFSVFLDDSGFPTVRVIQKIANCIRAVR